MVWFVGLIRGPICRFVQPMSLLNDKRRSHFRQAR
jgi:hypothetical protein